MDNLNNIPKSGNYGAGVDLHNDNYQKIGVELQTLRELGQNDKGYFETLSALQSKYPTPQSGWQAYVKDAGSSTGYYVANVNSSGNWVVTAAEAPPVNVDLAGYAKTGGSTKTVKEVEDEIVQLAGEMESIANVRYPTMMGYIHQNGNYSEGTNPNLQVTDFIRVYPGQKIITNAVSAVGYNGFYNSQKSPRRTTKDKILIIEEGDYYVRITNNLTENQAGIFINITGITDSFIDSDLKLKELVSPAIFSQKLKNITWVNGFISSLGGLLTSGHGNFRTTEHFTVKQGEVITTNAVGNDTNIVFYDKEGTRLISSKLKTVEAPSNAASCRLTTDNRLVPPADVYVISDLSKAIKDSVSNAPSIFLPDAFYNANFGNAIRGADLYHKMFKKIALLNYDKSSKFYIKTFRVEVNEEGVPTLWIRLNDETYNRTFGMKQGAIEGVSNVDDLKGVKKIGINAYGYFRTTGITSMTSSPDFYVGYVDIDLDIMKEIINDYGTTVNFGDGAGWSNPTYEMAGILNCEKLTTCESVSELLITNADEVSIGGVFFKKKKSGYVDVDYSALQNFDISKYYNISSQDKIITNYPRRIENIQFKTVDNTLLYLQGIVDGSFYFLDSNGNVYKKEWEKDNQITANDIIVGSDAIPSSIAYTTYKICNVFPLKHGGVLLQIYGTEPVNGNIRVCADTYILKDGIINLAFRKPSIEVATEAGIKAIIDYRPDRFSDNGDIIVIGDYGSRTHSGTIHMSWDGGETWKNIFRMKLSDESPNDIVNPDLNWQNNTETTKGNHIHAVHYDRYRDCVYVTTGDVGDNGVPYGVESSIYTCYNYKDEVPTWEQKSLRTNLLYGRECRQYLGIQSFPNCVIFGTDNGFDVGYDRINIGDSKQNIDYAYVSYSRNQGGGIKHMGSNLYRMDYNSPALGLLMDYNSNPDLDADGDYPSQLVSSFDGYKFQKLFTFEAGEIARMSIICFTDNYMYVRNRGISFTNKWFDRLNDSEIARCFTIKMSLAL